MTILEAYQADEQRVLDRLVDGELDAADRRTLIAALDDEPGAWRRCALTFLEAQSLGSHLHAIVAESGSPAPRAVAAQEAILMTTGNLPARRSWTSRAGRMFVLAASLLLAFGLGSRFGGEASTPTIAVVEKAPAAKSPAAKSPAAKSPAAKSPAAGTTATETMVAHSEAAPSTDPTAAEATSSPAVEPATAEAESPWETLTLAAGESGESGEEIMLRVLSEGDPADLFAAESAHTSGQLLQQLEQSGADVRRQQRLLPIDLSDGRRIVVPIEEFEIRSSTAWVY